MQIFPNLVTRLAGEGQDVVWNGVAPLFWMNMPPHQRPIIKAYSELMAASFQRLTGQALMATGADTASALWHAPQALVSHGTGHDPVFRYANAVALELWEMDWGSFTRLPSRLSAETDNRIQSSRDAVLKAVAEKGWVDGYAGIRISSSGRRFEIRDTVLWNVVDEQGAYHGQAALIQNWKWV